MKHLNLSNTIFSLLHVLLLSLPYRLIPQLLQVNHYTKAPLDTDTPKTSLSTVSYPLVPLMFPTRTQPDQYFQTRKIAWKSIQITPKMVRMKPPRKKQRLNEGRKNGKRKGIQESPRRQRLPRVNNY